MEACKGKIGRSGLCLGLMTACFLLFGIPVRAEGGETIKPGIYAGDIELSGMTEEQAEAAVEAYVKGLEDIKVVLQYDSVAEVTVTAGDLGIAWANPEIVTEAAELGTQGNVIERYKMLKDLEHENKIYPIELSFDMQKISDILTNKCAGYDQEAVDYGLIRENGEFRIIEGQQGYLLDVETSIDLIYDALTRGWDCQTCAIALDVAVEKPKGSVEELAQVKDVLGSFTTSFKSSNASRSANVENGCKLIDGILLYPGEEFSAYAAVSPFSESNGYYMAGSYINGKVVDSLGGGICQVSTTLYNAVLRAELEITERHNHSMVVSYVPRSADAAIAESSGKDFRFRNNLEVPVYIEGYIDKKQITFNIYGKETRDSGREVIFESEELEVNVPSRDEIYADASKPVGYIVSEGAHIGYKAKLWKIVKENGKEVSRTQVNSSTYKMVPRSATVGTATDDPAAYEQIMAAINSGSVDQVKAVIASLTAQAATNSVEIGEQ
ncbi:MAG: VanW family protein [Butyrivibrio sp.]|nr:VanW family protein [Acetatifactor muris]MCM1559353.1 VanW family protein [Butyrivibrio sp.]